MKKSLKFVLILLIASFVYCSNVNAYTVDSEIKADGKEYAITSSAAEGQLKGCSSNSSSVTARFDPETKTCWVKSNAKTESGVTGSIHLEKEPGAYGAGGASDFDIKFKSASGVEKKNAAEITSSKDFEADGTYQSLAKGVSGALYNCKIYKGSGVDVDGNCNIMSTSETDQDVVIEAIRSQAGSTETVYITVHVKGSNNSGVTVNENINSEADMFEICDANKSPKTVAALKLVGIFITIIKVIVPIIIIVLGMIDVSKAVLDNKDGNIMKQLISFLKRAIACLLIFFVPTIIIDLFHFIDGWDEVKSSYSTCIDCIFGSSSCPNVKFIDANAPAFDSSSGNGGSTTHTSSSGITGGGKVGNF